MGYYRVEAGVARLLKLGIEHDMPARIEAWQKDLDEGRLTDEMRQVFAGMGWLSSLRDGRLQPIADANGQSDPGPIRTTRRRRSTEPAVEPAPVPPPPDEKLIDTTGGHSD